MFPRKKSALWGVFSVVAILLLVTILMYPRLQTCKRLFSHSGIVAADEPQVHWLESNIIVAIVSEHSQSLISEQGVATFELPGGKRIVGADQSRQLFIAASADKWPSRNVHLNSLMFSSGKWIERNIGPVVLPFPVHRRSLYWHEGFLLAESADDVDTPKRKGGVTNPVYACAAPSINGATIAIPKFRGLVIFGGEIVSPAEQYGESAFIFPQRTLPSIAGLASSWWPDVTSRYCLAKAQASGGRFPLLADGSVGRYVCDRDNRRAVKMWDISEEAGDFPLLSVSPSASLLLAARRTNTTIFNLKECWRSSSIPLDEIESSGGLD